MRLLDACARKPVDATPVWLMRQAGRYLPEYRAIREKMSFVEMCRRPDVAAEVTLQPLRRFELDAAIVFADILLPLEPMGIGFHFSKDDGPVIERPIRGARDLTGVHSIDAASDLQYVMDTIKLVRHELDPAIPLIGFSGAPFTLASYIVEGGHSRNYAHVKKLMYEDPVTFGRLMSVISEVVVDYLRAQIAAGAQVVQLFDSWVGWLSPFDYELLVLPHVRYVVDEVKVWGRRSSTSATAPRPCSTWSARPAATSTGWTGASSSTAPGTSSATSPCRATSIPSRSSGRPRRSRRGSPTCCAAPAAAPGTSSTSGTGSCPRCHRTTSSIWSTPCTGSRPRRSELRG